MKSNTKIKFNKFKPVPQEPLSSQLYHFIRAHIINNILVPGTILSENELASCFSVSRQPVRDALARLAVEELIHTIPQKGSVVQRISVRDLDEVCFVRYSLESTAVREIVNADDRLFKRITTRLQKGLDAQRKIDKGSARANTRFLKLDDAFHEDLCAFSQTSKAWEMIEHVKGNLDRIRYFTFDHISDIDSLCDEHSAILNAILEKDIEKACALLRDHVFAIKKTYQFAVMEREDWFHASEVSEILKAKRKSK